MPVIDDDVWNDEDDDGHSNAELQREWESRRQEHYNTGYREGIEAGKHDTVQEGFDQGYVLGAMEGYAWGVLRGGTLSLQEIIDSKQEALNDSQRRLVHDAATAIASLQPGQVQETIQQKKLVSADNAKAVHVDMNDNVQRVKEEVTRCLTASGFTLPSRPPT